MRMLFRFVGTIPDLGLREEGISTLVFTLGDPAVQVELRSEVRKAAPY